MSEKLPQNVGIIGAGQLARMMVPYAKRFGFDVAVLQENCVGSPAHQMGATAVEGSILSDEAITKFVEMNDVTTWENDHINALTLFDLQTSTNPPHGIGPDAAVLHLIQDKYKQKSELQRLGFPVGSFTNNFDDIETKYWSEAVVKTRKGGYDGRGNLRVTSLDSPLIAAKFGDSPVYAERVIDFDKELSVIVARDKKGNVATYPVVETIHEDNICHTVIYPARIDSKVARNANTLARDVSEKFLRGAGVFAIEMFARGNDVYINEIASRVHNSGHLTIEASKTSQFEQHIRAVTGLPLGSTKYRTPAAVMVNILDPISPDGLSKVLQLPDTHVHLYGKEPPKPGLKRKIGHITVLASDGKTALHRAERAHGFLIAA